MKNIQYIILVIISFMFSCGDCVRDVRGVVIDFNTMKPLDSVFVIILNTNEEDHKYCYTNEEGEFSISDISGGFLHCPPMPLVFKKQGYDSIFREIDHIDTIIMKPLMVP